MRSNSSYFRLGLFVMTGVALLVAGIIVLGAGAMFNKTIAIETVTTESVDGLDVGAYVKFRGVPIGTVAKIEPAIWRHSQGTVEEHLGLGNQIVLELAINPRTFPTSLERVGCMRRHGCWLPDQTSGWRHARHTGESASGHRWRYAWKE